MRADNANPTANDKSDLPPLHLSEELTPAFAPDASSTSLLCAPRPRIVAIVQARMGSSRLPGKVMQKIAGLPMLQHVVSRARRAGLVDQVVVATSTCAEDNAIAGYCFWHDIACFRGSEMDVLDRYYQAAQYMNAPVIVRLTADCPLHDPIVIDSVIAAFLRGTFDYVSNLEPPTFPNGVDTEVFTMSALERAWREAPLPYEREHVTPYLRGGGNGIRTANVNQARDTSEHRWTVDELADLAFVRAVFHAMRGANFGMEDVLALLRDNPRLCEINARVPRNPGYQRSPEASRQAA